MQSVGEVLKEHVEHIIDFASSSMSIRDMVSAECQHRFDVLSCLLHTDRARGTMQWWRGFMTLGEDGAGEADAREHEAKQYEADELWEEFDLLDAVLAVIGR